MYNDLLNPDDQIDIEEALAFMVFDVLQNELDTCSYEDLAKGIAHKALEMVLAKFRPELTSQELEDNYHEEKLRIEGR